MSGDPFIFKNRIDKNTQDGILSRSYEPYRCEPKIKDNISIAGNKENGIKCTGKGNATKILKNSFIGFNKKAGVCIENEA